MRKAIAPLFAFMKRAPPQLPRLGVLGSPPRRRSTTRSRATTFATTVGVDFGTGKNLGMPGGRFELVIVDEDSKINVNLGASNDIAHIRLAQGAHGPDRPAAVQPALRAAGRDGQVPRPARRSARRIIDWADVDEQAFNCDTAARRVAGQRRRRGRVLPAPRRSPTVARTRPTTRSRSCTWCAASSEDFWATFVDPDPTNPKKRVVTVWGQGAVNVNSANAQTLLGVVCSGAPAADICIDPDAGAALSHRRDDGAGNHDGRAAVRLDAGLRHRR